MSAILHRSGCGVCGIRAFFFMRTRALTSSRANEISLRRRRGVSSSLGKDLFFLSKRLLLCVYVEY